MNTVKRDLDAISAHYRTQSDDAYALAEQLRREGSSTQYGVYSAANYWLSVAASANRAYCRAEKLASRCGLRKEVTP